MVVTTSSIILVTKVMMRGAIISAALPTRIYNAYELGNEPEVSSDFSHKNYHVISQVILGLNSRS